jgi:hypothetical protein
MERFGNPLYRLMSMSDFVHSVVLLSLTEPACKTDPIREERTVEFKFRTMKDIADDAQPDYTLQLPEVYPGGVAILTGPTGQQNYGGVMETILERMCFGSLDIFVFCCCCWLAQSTDKTNP